MGFRSWLRSALTKCYFSASRLAYSVSCDLWDCSEKMINACSNKGTLMGTEASYSKPQTALHITQTHRATPSSGHLCGSFLGRAARGTASQHCPKSAHPNPETGLPQETHPRKEPGLQEHVNTSEKPHHLCNVLISSLTYTGNSK